MSSARRKPQSAEYFASKAAFAVRPYSRAPGLLPLGTQTQWGVIRSVFSDGKERQYFCIDPRGGIALIPSAAMEESHTFGRKRRKRTTLDRKDQR